jgi:homoserine O-succinyltransferase/O-acetyltransferase
MTVLLERCLSGDSLDLLEGVRCVSAFPPRSEGAIEVGFVNNMPDAALESTERQFIGLLAEASGSTQVRVRMFNLPQIFRSEAARRRLRAHYAQIDRLFDAALDGLIVTGMEPGPGALSQEPYWPNFTDLIEWAKRHTTSAIWSCLAAHAAVLHCDEIQRRRLPQKCFGVFECEKVSDHPMLPGLPTHTFVPHSRWNDLPADALVADGYQILTKSADAGTDMFVKHDFSLFVFLQGHPEYDPTTLLREYRRDVGRYLRGESEIYPETPRSYLDATNTRSLGAFRTRALSARNPDLMETFPVIAVRDRVVDLWRASALSLYRNWLSYLVSGREQSVRTGASVIAGEC